MEARSEVFFFYDLKKDRFLELEDGMVFGRSHAAVQFPDDEEVSRKHFEISIRSGKVWIEDLGSTNRTLVNALSLTLGTPIALKLGDAVYFGSQKLVLTNQCAQVPKTMPKLEPAAAGFSIQLGFGKKDRKRGGNLIDRPFQIPHMDFNSLIRKPAFRKMLMAGLIFSAITIADVLTAIPVVPLIPGAVILGFWAISRTGYLKRSDISKWKKAGASFIVSGLACFILFLSMAGVRNLIERRLTIEDFLSGRDLNSILPSSRWIKTKFLAHLSPTNRMIAMTAEEVTQVMKFKSIMLKNPQRMCEGMKSPNPFECYKDLTSLISKRSPLMITGQILFASVGIMLSEKQKKAENWKQNRVEMEGLEMLGLFIQTASSPKKMHSFPEPNSSGNDPDAEKEWELASRVESVVHRKYVKNLLGIFEKALTKAEDRYSGRTLAGKDGNILPHSGLSADLTELPDPANIPRLKAFRVFGLAAETYWNPRFASLEKDEKDLEKEISALRVPGFGS